MKTEVTNILARMGIALGQTVPSQTVEAIEFTLDEMRRWRSVTLEEPPRNEYLLISVDGVYTSGCLAYCDDNGIWHNAYTGEIFNRQDFVCFWRPL